MPGWAAVAASGSQVWNGHSGALMANATKNPRNSHFCVAGRERDVGELGEQERAGMPAVRRVHVQRDDRDQHQQPAEQAVQQELDRRVLPLADPEAADQEVHRDQHGLEEYVEQEHVGGGEDADHHRLEHQQQREVGLHPAPRPGPRAGRQGAVGGGHRHAVGRRWRVGVVPRRQHDHRHQHGGHPDQYQPDAVHADRVVHAELRDPLVGLGELELRAIGLEGHHHGDGQAQRDQAEHQGQPLDQQPPGDPVGLAARGRAAWADGDGQRADQRDGADDGEPGERAHDRRSPRFSPAGGRRPAAPRRGTWTARRTGRTRSAPGAAGPRCRRWSRPPC